MTAGHRKGSTRRGAAFLAAATALTAAAATAAPRWTVSPSLGAALIWTDNVDLAPPGSEDAELVTELTPGVRIERRGRRLQVSAAYRMRALFHADNSDRNDIRHRLEAEARSELVRRTLFLDAEASVDQVLVSARDRGGVSDLTSGGNRSDVVRYAVAPRFERGFGPVTTRVVLRHEVADFTRGAADTTAETAEIRVANRRPSRLSWSVDYRDENLDREGTTDTEHRTLEGNAAWRAGRSLSLLARAGREDHELATARRLENGSYWSAGFAWTPNRHFSMRALEGDRDREVSVRIAPTPRTSLDLTWRDRDVGLNPSGAWDATLTQRNRRSTLRLRYSEEVTSVQRLILSGQQAFVLIDPATGSPVLDPATGLPVVILTDVFSLADGEFLRERGELTWDLRGARTTLRTSLFGERRTFEAGGEVERARGAVLSLERRLGARSRGAVRASRVRNEFDDGRKDDTSTGEVEFSRESARHLTFSVAYRHQRRDSTDPTAEYRENRITLRLNKRF